MKLLLIIGMGLMASAIWAQDGNVEGFVFRDDNRNGVRDEGEQGVSGVAVSNQHDVTVTDNRGHYRLPLRENMVLFISKPADYELPRNSFNIPQFYYIHDLQGSTAALKYNRTSPASKANESQIDFPLESQIDFPLLTATTDSVFSALIVGDIQVRNDKELSYFRREYFPDFLESPAKFILTLGDNAYDSLGIYNSYTKSLALLNKPVFHVAGNHDMNYDVDADSLALETYTSYLGSPYYSFNYGKVHFVVLDDIEYSGQDSLGRFGGYRGFLSAGQLRWLENDLRVVPPENLLVFAMHIPLYVRDSNGSDAVNVINREKLFKLLEGRKYLLALSGHMHYIDQWNMTEAAGWHGESRLNSIIAGAACGAWWTGPKDLRGIPASYEMDGTPNGYFILECSGRDYKTRFVNAPVEPFPGLRIIEPEDQIRTGDSDTLWVTVNIYDAGDSAQVWFRIDQMEPVQMQQIQSEDKFMKSYLKKYRASFPAWLNSVYKTFHIWQGVFPAKSIEPGLHKIQIHAEDWGKSWEQQMLFEKLNR